MLNFLRRNRKTPEKRPYRPKEGYSLTIQSTYIPVAYTLGQLAGKKDESKNNEECNEK